MNTKAEIALKQFDKDLNAFLIACNDLEELGTWNVRKRGPMATYFEADLFTVALQVMSADGVFERAEAEVLNAMFSTSYTPRELSQMYHSSNPVIDDYFSKTSQDALGMLSGLDANLADAYRGLLLDACEIISLSDGVAEKSERELIAQLQEVLR